MMFSSAFSLSFAGVPSGVSGGFVCPMMGQALLTDGAVWAVDGHNLLIGGARLIGQAGKVFEFATPENAGRWVENARNIGQRERLLIAGIEPAAAALWKARKREKLAVIAGRCVNAAARQGDEAKRAALLAESSYCLSKWAA